MPVSSLSRNTQCGGGAFAGSWGAGINQSEYGRPTWSGVSSQESQLRQFSESAASLGSRDAYAPSYFRSGDLCLPVSRLVCKCEKSLARTLGEPTQNALIGACRPQTKPGFLASAVPGRSLPRLPVHAASDGGSCSWTRILQLVARTGF